LQHNRIDEIHQKTHIIQIIQPIKDTVVEGITHETRDEGTTVHHLGNTHSLETTEKQLAEAREQYIRSMTSGSSHDERHYETTEEPVVNRMERINVVETVIPVFESELEQRRSGQQSTTRGGYKAYEPQQQQQQAELVGVMPVVSKPADTTTTNTTTSSNTGTISATGGATTTTGTDEHVKQL
jgi:hypothetical protein